MAGWRRWLAALAVAVASLRACVGAGARPAPARASQVTVADRRGGHGAAAAEQLSSGLAFTYRPIPGWVGPASQPVDPVLVQLIRNLAPHGRPLLRIGGESADHSWWPIAGYRKPFGITYDLTPAWTRRRAAGSRRRRKARLMLGLNLQADRPTLVRVESHELLRRIGRRIHPVVADRQ